MHLLAGATYDNLVEAGACDLRKIGIQLAEHLGRAQQCADNTRLDP